MHLHLQALLAPKAVDLRLVGLTGLVVAQRDPRPWNSGMGVWWRRRCAARPAFRRRDRPWSGLIAIVGRWSGPAQPPCATTVPIDPSHRLVCEAAALGGRTQNFPFATSHSASFSNSAFASSRFNRAFCSRTQPRRYRSRRRGGARCTAWPQRPQLSGDLLTGLALGGQLVRSAELAHDVLRGMPLPASHIFTSLPTRDWATRL